jgi:hypothetical protein
MGTAMSSGACATLATSASHVLKLLAARGTATFRGRARMANVIATLALPATTADRPSVRTSAPGMEFALRVESAFVTLPIGGRIAP